MYPMLGVKEGNKMTDRSGGRIRIGVAGLGAAGRAFLPAIELHPGFQLAAIAEPVQATRESVVAETGAKGFETLASMLDGSELDAVYIATPTELHPEHAREAFRAKKHVLSEKPMAVRIEEAQAMIEQSRQASTVFVVGHAHGFDLPIQRMREIVAGGDLGRLRMIHTWNFTDWAYRPRRPEELDTGKGGGVTFRQGAHQFDIIRVIGGGLVESVRANTFDWDPQRSVVGAHTTLLRLAGGAVATAVYNGYGYFSTIELCADVTEWGFLEPIEQRTPVTRPGDGRSAADELEAKRKRAKNAIPASAPLQPTFGLTIVSCERGDIRQSPNGLFVYTDKGREEILLPKDKSPRDLVLDEFFDAITGAKAPLHDGPWSMANLEICLAALESSATNREIELKLQVGLPV
jgi:phthalate 4,5-cis-dihydrodiol dehydrogenase